MAVRILKNPIRKSELVQIASEEFGDVVKAVVDVEQEIITIGGELHADGEVELMEVIAYYLAHDEAREEIARAGRGELVRIEGEAFVFWSDLAPIWCDSVA